MKFNCACVIAFSANSVASLVSGAKKYSEKVVLIYSGERSAAVGADEAHYMGETGKISVLNYVPQITDVVVKEKADLFLTDNSTDGRLVAGILAGRLGAGILTDLTTLTVEGTDVCGVNMVYGGAAFKTDSVTSEVKVLCLAGEFFEADTLEPCANVYDMTASEAGIRFVEKQEIASTGVNLSAAKTVVAVGRGVADEALLAKAFDFAKSVGAEVGCTRPVAEELNLMPKETYIGVSGLMLKPAVYFGLGVSGQVQHMVGVNQAKTVIAINKDKNAPIFQQCDYGLVADIDAALTAIKGKN